MLENARRNQNKIRKINHNKSKLKNSKWGKKLNYYLNLIHKN